LDDDEDDYNDDDGRCYDNRQQQSPQQHAGSAPGVAVRRGILRYTPPTQASSQVTVPKFALIWHDVA